MILASFDVETTGLNLNEDRIIEIGLVLYSTGRNKILESTGILVQSDNISVSDEITGLTGITQDAVDKFGYTQWDGVEAFNDYAAEADAVVGHNITWFDLPIIRNTAKREGLDLVPIKLVIDTMTDLPNTKGEQLITMCAKQGWVNPHQHSAEDDAKAVIKLMSEYDIDEVAQRAMSPLVVIRSHQDMSNNSKASKLGFRWKPHLNKRWLKAIKECDLEQEKQKAPFSITLEKDVLPEYLRD
jgi:DNA polymerase III alpha subunit (gram-positive type)